MLEQVERAFVDRKRVARLATADATGVPHVVPVCYALADIGMGETLYITIDQKPKRPGARLKRLVNIASNPAVSVVIDHYDEDWSALAWVMLAGTAAILDSGSEHDAAHDLLRGRYPQYAGMVLTGLPVIAVRIGKVTSWGRL